jgi:hypothetical protein
MYTHWLQAMKLVLKEKDSSTLNGDTDYQFASMINGIRAA